MRFTDLRLKIKHFFRKNKKIIIIVLSIWAIIVFINHMLKNREVEPEATTTYEPHVSVMSDSSSTPQTMQDPIEKMIEKYVECCNEQNYEEAFNLLSEACREYQFNNSPIQFIEYAHTKIPAPREYSIQSYSNMTIGSKKIYIYEVKYTEDLLATGLTETDYYYTSDKMAFYRDEDGNIKMSVGSYIYQTPVQSISENEYLKIDIIDKVVNYATEQYKVKLTNRSEHTVVIANGYEESEIVLRLNQEVRNRYEQEDIVLRPGESITENFTFQKYADDGDNSLSINFNSIRVMENYSGTENVPEEIIQAEINNAVAKFSMTISVTE